MNQSLNNIKLKVETYNIHNKTGRINKYSMLQMHDVTTKYNTNNV